MKLLAIIFLSVLPAFMVPVSAQGNSNRELFSRQNLVAWCIVPFDKAKRTPAERASMLKELGITQLAYDWRDEHLPTMEEEFRELGRHQIKLKAVWFWVNGKADGGIDDANEFILKALEKNAVRTELWLSFNDRFFAGLSDDEKLKKAVRTVGNLNKRARSIGCTLHLYNHGSWFGEPRNQVRIIEALAMRDIGIVYNFHHARHQTAGFPNLLEMMLPYLTTVNINGMREGGPMILTVGDGDRELNMLQTLKASGYTGSIGILSHVDNEDARVVLERNMEGLKRLLEEMKDDAALATY